MGAAEEQKLIALARSLVADIDAMQRGDGSFGPFSEYDADGRGAVVSWPNLAILRDQIEAALAEVGGAA